MLLQHFFNPEEEKEILLACTGNAVTKDIPIDERILLALLLDHDLLSQFYKVEMIMRPLALLLYACNVKKQPLAM